MKTEEPIGWGSSTFTYTKKDVDRIEKWFHDHGEDVVKAFGAFYGQTEKEPEPEPVHFLIWIDRIRREIKGGTTDVYDKWVRECADFKFHLGPEGDPQDPDNDEDDD